MFRRGRVATPRRPGEDGGRRDARLDPVRWRRPGRSALIRAAAVCALLVAAVSVAWSRPGGCAPFDPTAMTANTSAGVDPASDAVPASVSGQPDSAEVGDGPPGSGRPGGAEPAGDRPGGGQGARRPAVPAGTVGVPVRLAEATALRLVHAGDRVDLIGVDPDGGSPNPVADDALVLGVTGADDPSVGGLLLALDPAEARRTVGAPERTRFAVLIHPGR